MPVDNRLTGRWMPSPAWVVATRLPDVLLLRFGGDPRRLAIRRQPSFMRGKRVSRVFEHGLDARWLSHVVRPIASRGWHGAAGRQSAAR